jgi:hypothetical protein
MIYFLDYDYGFDDSKNKNYLDMGLDASIYATSLKEALKNLSYEELETCYCSRLKTLKKSKNVFNLDRFSYRLQDWCVDNLETGGNTSMILKRIILTPELVKFICENYEFLKWEIEWWAENVEPLLKNKKKFLYIDFS